MCSADWITSSATPTTKSERTNGCTRGGHRVWDDGWVNGAARVIRVVELAASRGERRAVVAAIEEEAGLAGSAFFVAP
jgi:hypothetical protein